MTISVTHNFVSAVPDDPTAAAAGQVLPSHWNQGHLVTGAVDGSGTAGQLALWTDAHVLGGDAGLTKDHIAVTGANTGVTALQIKAGDTLANVEISGVLPGPIMYGSLSIQDASGHAVTDSGSLLEILTGDTGSGGTNTINHASGAYSFSFNGASTGPVTVSYIRAQLGGSGVISSTLSGFAVEGLQFGPFGSDTYTLTVGKSAAQLGRISVVADEGTGGIDHRIDILGRDPQTGGPSIRSGIDPDVEPQFRMGAFANYLDFYPSPVAPRTVDTIGLSVGNFANFYSFTPQTLFPDGAGDNQVDLGSSDDLTYGTVRWRTLYLGTSVVTPKVALTDGAAPVDATASSVVLNSVAPNADLTLTAKTKGNLSPPVTVTLHNTGGTNAESIVTTGLDIVVTLATTLGTITSTANSVKATIDGDTGGAADLVTVAVQGTGLGLVDAFETPQPTAGGIDGTVGTQNDVIAANGAFYGCTANTTVNDAGVTGGAWKKFTLEAA